jgi:CRISPR/Cas system CMR subunit Cmr6 (Cas7 group RAMP superfamily)
MAEARHVMTPHYGAEKARRGKTGAPFPVPFITLKNGRRSRQIRVFGMSDGSQGARETQPYTIIHIITKAATRSIYVDHAMDFLDSIRSYLRCLLSPGGGTPILG